MIQRPYPESEQLRKLRVLRDIYFKAEPITTDSFLYNNWVEFCIFHLCPVLEKRYNIKIHISRAEIEKQGYLIDKLYTIHYRHWTYLADK